MGLNIQEFSERTGVSKSALRFYEQKKLLIPQERSENGYRVYSTDQIEAAKLISSLRLADIPIKEIQNYLSENNEGTRKKVMENWITTINKKRELLNISLRYLESDSINRDIYLIEKGVEQIIWYDAEAKIGEFHQYFLDRGNELKKFNITFKNFYLKYISGKELIKAQIGFGVEKDVDLSGLPVPALIERVPQSIYIAMPYKNSISTIQRGYRKILSYALEHNWTPISSVIEWYHGTDFTQLDLLMPVTQMERRGE